MKLLLELYMIISESLTNFDNGTVENVSQETLLVYTTVGLEEVFIHVVV